MGPVILSLFLGGKHGWRGGYGAVCAIQFCLVAVLAVTLPMWDRYEDRAALRAEAAAAKQAGKKQSTLNIPGVKGALATFFFYCAIEAAAGLWGASYLVEARGFQQRRRPGACRCTFWASLWDGSFPGLPVCV